MTLKSAFAERDRLWRVFSSHRGSSATEAERVEARGRYAELGAELERQRRLCGIGPAASDR